MEITIKELPDEIILSVENEDENSSTIHSLKSAPGTLSDFITHYDLENEEETPPQDKALRLVERLLRSHKDEVKTASGWTDLLTDSERELNAIANLLIDTYPNAPIVGRNMLVLISKQAEMLNRISRKTGINIPELYYPEG